jgi:starvation-inducible DNA-binding protein
MEEVNQIGLDTDKTKQLVEKLNSLLANNQIFYINARGFYWNIPNPGVGKVSLDV